MNVIVDILIHLILSSAIVFLVIIMFMKDVKSKSIIIASIISVAINLIPLIIEVKKKFQKKFQKKLKKKTKKKIKKKIKKKKKISMKNSVCWLLFGRFKSIISLVFDLPKCTGLVTTLDNSHFFYLF